MAAENSEQLKELEAAKVQEIKKIRLEAEVEKTKALAEASATSCELSGRIKKLELEVQTSSSTVQKLLKQLEVS